MYTGRKISYSHNSLNSINQIRKYITKDSQKRAENFVNKLIFRISNLKQFPYLGVKIEENKYVYLIDKKYLVKYRIEKETIYILTIKNIKLK